MLFRSKGCFNSVAWDFQYGQAYTLETEQEILQALAPDYIRGLSLLGGEPMEPQNRATVLSLVKKVREIYPGRRSGAIPAMILIRIFWPGWKREIR